MEGSYDWVTLPVVSYQIVDSDDLWHHPSNPRDFDEASALLVKLKEESPYKDFTLFAELL